MPVLGVNDGETEVTKRTAIRLSKIKCGVAVSKLDWVSEFVFWVVSRKYWVRRIRISPPNGRQALFVYSTFIQFL